MSEEDKYVDFATVRDMLESAKTEEATLPTNKSLLFNTHNGLQVIIEMATKPTQRYLKLSKPPYVRWTSLLNTLT